MKNKIILFYTIALAIVFTILFLNKNIGLNSILYGIFLTPYLFLSHPKNKTHKKSIVSGILFLGMSIVPFFHQSTYVFIAYFVSLFLCIGTLINPKNSFVTQVLNGIYNTISFLKLKKEATNQKFNFKKYGFYLFLIGITVLIASIFILLYSTSNEKFAELFSGIHIRLDWIFTTLAAFVIVYKISFSDKIDTLTNLDLNSPIQLLKGKESSKEQKRKIQETQIGNSLLLTLNIILLFYLVTFFMESLVVEEATLSDAVHQGVNTLIISILFAIAIILYFFRGNINFYKNNKTLKTLSFLWIALNICLVFTIIYRNSQYIQYSGLTYKRFGVLLFLSATLIGLFTTFIKIQKKKTIWYLVKTNFQIIGIFLLVISFFNWNKIFTKYNLYHAEVQDIHYIFSIKYDISTLKKYSDTHTLPENIKTIIDTEYELSKFEKENQNWQELTLDHFQEE